MVRHLDAAFARVWTLSSDGRELQLLASAGMYTRLDGSHSRIPFGQLKIGLIAQERKPHLTSDAQTDPRVNDKEWARREGMISFAGYPLLVEDRLVGVMGMFAQKPLPESTLEALSFVADAMAQVMDRKRAQEALRHSEAYLAESQRLTHTGSWAAEPGTRDPVYLSDEIIRMWGYDPEREFPTRDQLFERIHPEDRDRVLATNKKALREKTDLDYEYRIVLPDGTVKHIHTTVHLMMNAAGEVVEALGTNVDVTERKRAENALRRSENQLRNVIDTIPAMAWTAVPDGTNIFSSRQWTEYTGLGVEGSAGSGWEAAVHPEDLARYLEKWQASLASAQPFENEVRIRGTANSKYRWFLARALPLRDEVGNILSWYGVLTDIEDRKRAEEELREAEMRFRTYVDHATDALLVHDEDGVVLDVNAQACASLGYTRQELIGMHPRSFNPTMNSAIHQSVKERLESGEIFTFETAHRRKDGTVFPVEVRLRPFHEGSRVFCLALVQDISERKLAEAERQRLHQLEAELTRINRVTTMGELTASLAHEINQPIAAAVTNANTSVRWLANEVPDIAEAREAAKRAAKDATRAAEIVSRIRSMFKKENPQRELVDVNQVIDEMVMMLLRSETNRSGVSIRSELAAGLPETMADRVQLQQVVLNLMMNGIDAMKDVDGARTLTVGSRRNGKNELVISVTDMGIGLPADNTRLFEAFFTTKPHGTGMGLAIGRSIIEAHGGRLWASSNAGRGATFSFTLPINTEAQG
jgi:PAS domain S-box-containing protein